MTDPDPPPEHWATWITGIATSCDECGTDANLCPFCGERAGVLLYRDLIGIGDEDWKCRACREDWSTRHEQPRPWPHRLRTRVHVALIDARYRVADLVTPRHRAR